LAQNNAKLTIAYNCMVMPSGTRINSRVF